MTIFCWCCHASSSLQLYFLIGLPEVKDLVIAASTNLKNELLRNFPLIKGKTQLLKEFKDAKSLCGSKYLPTWVSGVARPCSRLQMREVLQVPVSSGSGSRPFLYAEGDYAGAASCHKHLLRVAHMQRF